MNVDLGEVDDEHGGLLGARLEQGGAHVLGVVEVELAREGNHCGSVALLDTCYCGFAPSPCVCHKPIQAE